MILKASQRSGARELAKHLLNAEANEHVTVHEVSGFISEDLLEALEEIYAISRGTRCKQFLFSLSLNPPDYADVSIEEFEAAIAEIEKSLGLSGQPRIIVFHEKNGRRHCHCIWSRIKISRMIAVNMAHYKYKLASIARGLYLQYGWKMPKGFKKKTKSSSKKDSIRKSWKKTQRRKTQPQTSKEITKTIKPNYTRAEWQQAKRIKDDPIALKKFFKECWERSDDRKSFAYALQEMGFYLAKGDRRGYVAVDYQGEVYSLSRWLKINNKELKSRLGDSKKLPSIEVAKTYLKSRFTENIKKYIAEHRVAAKQQRSPLVYELRSLVKYQREERNQLLEKQRKYWEVENINRARRISHGVRGVWEHVTGKYQKIRKLNEGEVKVCLKRDRVEQQGLIRKHLKESKDLHKTLKFFRRKELVEEQRLKATVAEYINTATEPKIKVSNAKETIAEEITALEGEIESVGDDITALLSLLGGGQPLSESIRAKIRVMIERAREALQFKQQDTEHWKHLEIKAKEEAKEQLEEMQKILYKFMQQQEELRVQQEQIKANKAFYFTIENMSYSLNGIPLHEIKMVAKHEVKFDEKIYCNSLKAQSVEKLLRSVKHECGVAQLRQNSLQAKELLRRINKKPNGTGRRKNLKPSKLKIKLSQASHKTI